MNKDGQPPTDWKVWPSIEPQRHAAANAEYFFFVKAEVVAYDARMALVKLAEDIASNPARIKYSEYIGLQTYSKFDMLSVFC